MEFKETIDNFNEDIAKRQLAIDGFVKRASELDASIKDKSVTRSEEDSKKILDEAKDIKAKLDEARNGIEETKNKKQAAINEHEKALADAERDSKKILGNPKGEKEMKDEIMEARGKALKETKAYQIPADEVRSLLLSDSIAKPGDASTSSNGYKTPAILNMVWIDPNHNGRGYEEVDYVKTIGAAGAGTAGTNATQADDVHGKVKLVGTLIKRTSQVDSHIKDNTNVNYAQITSETAMYSTEKALANAIVLALSTSIDSAGAKMYAEKTVTKIDENFVNNLDMDLKPVGDPAGEPTLVLNRTNLKTIGSLRGTNEKKKIFDITYDAGTRDSGRIVDGGTVINFCIDDSLADTKLIYGYLKALKVDLFAPLTVSSDESQYFDQDMIAIKGETQVGAGIVFYQAVNVITIGA